MTSFLEYPDYTVDKLFAFGYVGFCGVYGTVVDAGDEIFGGFFSCGDVPFILQIVFLIVILDHITYRTPIDLTVIQTGKFTQLIPVNIIPIAVKCIAPALH